MGNFSNFRVFILAAAAITTATAAAQCEGVKLKNADIAKIRVEFSARYCGTGGDARCDVRWANFSQLLERVAVDDRSQHIPLASFLLATAYVETFNRDFSASTNEVRGAVNEGRPYWREDAETKMKYFGRGWLQLTWKDKYRRASRELQIDLVKNPDLALKPDIAFEILLRGLTQGWIETYRSTPTGGAGTVPISVNDFLFNIPPDYARARAAINANCVGSCSAKDRTNFREKGYIPVPAKIDAAKGTEVEAKFFERTLCMASAR